MLPTEDYSFPFPRKLVLATLTCLFLHFVFITVMLVCPSDHHTLIATLFRVYIQMALQVIFNYFNL